MAKEETLEEILSKSRERQREIREQYRRGEEMRQARIEAIKNAPKPPDPEREERQRQLRKERRERNRREKRLLKLALDVVDLGYKAKAKRLHPDAGGTSEDMHELQEMKQLLIACLETEFKNRKYYVR